MYICKVINNEKTEIMKTVTLSLDKITKGFYSKSVDGVTIELINPKSYTHGLSEDNQWKLTIETKNELAIVNN